MIKISFKQGALFALSIMMPGCGLLINSSSNLQDAPVDFSAELAPLLQNYCVQCHSNGGMAPFPLQTYQQVKQRAGIIAYAVKTRSMPPWGANDQDGCQPLEHSLYLPDEAIDVFQRFKKNNKPGAPIPPITADNSFFEIESPDAMGTQTPTYVPQFSDGDDFRCFIVDVTIPAGAKLTAIDFIPVSGDPENLGKNQSHHAQITQLPTTAMTDDARALDALDTAPGFDCSTTSGNSAFVGGGITIWTPGGSNPYFPEGTGKVLNDQPLIVTMHYSNGTGESGTGIPVGFNIPLKYTFDPVQTLHTGIIRGGGGASVIPPGAVTVSGNTVIQAGSNRRIHRISPHAHLIAKKIEMSIDPLQGDNYCAVNVENWDFSWQRRYTYKVPVDIYSGEIIHTVCEYFNPYIFNVLFGENTYDEMCIGSYDYTEL